MKIKLYLVIIFMVITSVITYSYTSLDSLAHQVSQINQINQTSSTTVSSLSDYKSISDEVLEKH